MKGIQGGIITWGLENSLQREWLESSKVSFIANMRLAEIIVLSDSRATQVQGNASEKPPHQKIKPYICQNLEIANFSNINLFLDLCAKFTTQS
jgi:hypothetical protein